MINYKESKQISDKDLRFLYEALGWAAYTRAFSDLSELLQTCQLVISAWDDDKLVGLVRTVGDGLSIQYIQDILVLPDYQKQGIGKALLARVLEQSKSIRQVVLMTEKSEENRYILVWYQKQGFVPYEDMGLQGFWRK